MSVKNFEVKHTIEDACSMIKTKLDAELVDETVINMADGTKVITLAYEKYFFRVSNRVGLFIILENTKGITKIKSVATGASESLFFKFDWGASNSFSDEVENLFSYNV